MEYPSTSLLYIKSLVDSDEFCLKVYVESNPSLQHCTQSIVISLRRSWDHLSAHHSFRLLYSVFLLSEPPAVNVMYCTHNGSQTTACLDLLKTCLHVSCLFLRLATSPSHRLSFISLQMLNLFSHEDNLLMSLRANELVQL